MNGAESTLKAYSIYNIALNRSFPSKNKKKAATGKKKEVPLLRQVLEKNFCLYLTHCLLHGERLSGKLTASLVYLPTEPQLTGHTELPTKACCTKLKC